MQNIYKFIILISLISFITNCATQKNLMIYPETKKINYQTKYFGEIISDPYQWLEYSSSVDTLKWIADQNKITFNYLSKIPYKNKIKNDLTNILNYEKVKVPFIINGYEYYFKNSGLQQHFVLYRKKDNKEEIFLDPNNFSKDGSVSLTDISFSKDGSLVAYSISESGSDWRKIIILNTNNKKQIDNVLTDIKFSEIAWRSNEGFYYSKYDLPNGSKLTNITDKHKLYFHKLGDLQTQDKVVFGDQINRRYVTGYVTEDEKFLIIEAANNTSENELYLQKLDSKESNIINIINLPHTYSQVIDSQGYNLYIVTNFRAQNKQLVKININNPEHWDNIIPQKDMVLDVSKDKGYFFAHYIKDVKSVIDQYSYSGKKIRTVKLPGLGTINGFSGMKSDKVVYYSFTNFITPNTIYTYNVEDGTSQIYIKPKIRYDINNYSSEQIFYTSFDGTKIPMFIIHKKNIEYNGKNPTILYGYGGFNISLMPNFSPSIITWLENGGIYVIVNLRGGGEYGKKWHDEGRLFNKKNVFKDFISAANYLYNKNYTSSQYTAIYGASNGGLLVGAVMTQNPSIAKVALPAVGVLDMLKYHKFTSGAGWSYDYGTAEDSKQMFDYLRSYSPLHNVKENTCYPATLVMTADHDDRVVPAHSFKFIAQLQNKQTCARPVLIRIETKVGHGTGKSTSALIDEISDMYAFTLWNINNKN